MASSVVITRKGGPRVLKVLETPDPRPANGEVLVDVKSAGINYADIVARMGLYPPAPKPPFVPGFEAAGIVAQGNGKDFKPGDRVVGLRLFGAQSSRIAIDGGTLLKIPDNIGFEEAAAIPVNYLTAYHALYNLACLKAGETVLIHAAAGGVGTAACQLALNSGAIVIGVAGGETKMEYLRKLKVQHTIDRRISDFAAEVKKICPAGVDVILDSVGGRTFRINLKLLGVGGRLVALGVAGLASHGRTNIVKLLKEVLTFPKVRVVDMMMANIGVFGMNLTGLYSRKDQMRQILADLYRMASEGVIKPYISKTYKPDDIAEAHRHIQSGESLGKLVINWN